MQKDATHGRATLTGGANTGEYAGFQGKFQISVFHYDGSIVATKFENASSKSLSDILANLLAHSSGPSKRYQWHSAVIHEQAADVRTPAAEGLDAGEPEF